MTKLSDTQAILLSTAAQRDTLSVLPLPATVRASGAGKAITALVKRGFAEEREATNSASVHRTDGDIRYSVFATAAGLAAIGIDDGVNEAAANATPAPKPPSSKSAAVLALLQRADGATLAELIAATGWLPHTTRAALTGLRKKGHAVERSKREDATCYRVAV